MYQTAILRRLKLKGCEMIQKLELVSAAAKTEDLATARGQPLSSTQHASLTKLNVSGYTSRTSLAKKDKVCRESLIRTHSDRFSLICIWRVHALLLMATDDLCRTH